MAINNKLKCLLLAGLFLSGLFRIQAQTTGYFLDPDSEEPRFIQRLAWSGGTYSLHFEVIIEKEEGAGFASYLNKIVIGNYLDISLPPGNYRYRVIPYDILNKPSEGTQWAAFKVFNAVKPEIFKPEEDLEYYNDNRGSKFEFYGKNIEPDAQVYFVNSKGEHIVPVETIRSDDGSSIRVVFDKNQLIDGEYEVFIINPGGLETSLGGIDYKSYREKFGLMHYFVGASFMPSFQSYGEELNPGGFLFYINARIGIISCLFSSNYIGMEFSVSRYTKFTDDDVEGGFTTGYSLLFMNWLPGRKAAVNLKMGIGFDMQPMELNYQNLGVSFLYRIYQNFNIEVGINFSRPLDSSKVGDIQPWAGLTIIF